MIIEIPNVFAVQTPYLPHVAYVANTTDHPHVTFFFPKTNTTPERALKAFGIKLLGGNSDYYEIELPPYWVLEDNAIWDRSARKRFHIHKDFGGFGGFVSFIPNFLYIGGGIYSYRLMKKDGILLSDQYNLDEFKAKFPKYKSIKDLEDFGNPKYGDLFYNTYEALIYYWDDTIIFEKLFIQEYT